MDLFDIAIVGGGINGMGIAADAAGRGLKVCVFDQHDFSSGTSSASTKLIHGGLRYLEYYHFKLVREALHEREILLAKAPHIITPLEFVIPENGSTRPRWLLSIGLWLYDHLGGHNSLPKSKYIKLNSDPIAAPLQTMHNAFVYSDCWVDDARLVLVNAIAAANNGAQLYPRHKIISARRDARHWYINACGSNCNVHIQAKLLINATGPWVNSFLQQIQQPQTYTVNLVQGSHIILPRLYSGEHAYLLQNSDGRVIFIIPYAEQFTLIGTTEVAFKGDLENVAITADEISYLCAAANKFLRVAIKPEQIVATYSGVRPLREDESESLSAVSREYTLDFQHSADLAPLLNIYGGKITTYRRLAERAVNLFSNIFPQMLPAWTATANLPGGDLCGYTPEVFEQQLLQQFPQLSPSLLRRLAKSYGSLLFKFLNANTVTTADLGIDFGHELYQVEVDYLCQHEWAETAEDILWRRTKLGLLFTADEVRGLQDYILHLLTNTLAHPLARI